MASVSEVAGLIIFDFRDIEYHFRVMKDVGMGKLKKTFASANGLEPTQLRFIWGDNELKDDDTPRKLEMKSKEIVVVILKNSKKSNKPESTALGDNKDSVPKNGDKNVSDLFESISNLSISEVKKKEVSKSAMNQSIKPASVFLQRKEKPMDEEKVIVIKVVDEQFQEFNFHVRMNQNLGKLKKAYAHRIGIELKHLVFIFHCQEVKDDDTPFKLGMIEDSSIDVFQKK